MLENFIGVWRGRGVASYPTIDTSDYREEFTFQDHPDAPRIQYEQKTWRIHEDGGESLLHWEYGFLTRLEHDAIQWINAQNNGRVEVLTGTVSFENGVYVMEVHSAAFANDPRMVESSRRVEVKGNHLHYVQQMATTTTQTPKMQVHLEATLTRS